MSALLSHLGLKADNPGSCVAGQWLDSARRIDSINPATAQVIARVAMGDDKTYAAVIEGAHEAFETWRQVPAPKRGDIIRQIGNQLRTHKDQLGSLVALEMGKSKQEGDAEVQEMIDIADFCRWSIKDAIRQYHALRATTASHV